MGKGLAASTSLRGWIDGTGLGGYSLGRRMGCQRVVTEGANDWWKDGGLGASASLPLPLQSGT